MPVHMAQPCWRRAKINKTETMIIAQESRLRPALLFVYSLGYVILLLYLWACSKCRKDKGDLMFRKFKDDPYFKPVS